MVSYVMTFPTLPFGSIIQPWCGNSITRWGDVFNNILKGKLRCALSYHGNSLPCQFLSKAVLTLNDISESREQMHQKYLYILYAMIFKVDNWSFGAYFSRTLDWLKSGKNNFQFIISCLHFALFCCGLVAPHITQIYYVQPLYIFPTTITYRNVSGFATGCPCVVRGQGLTTCPLYVSSLFHKSILNGF